MEEVPHTPKRKRLTRDQRRDILLLRSLGKTYSEIATHLSVSEGAVQYTCNIHKATPKKDGRGRPSKLSKEEVDDLVAYVRRSQDTRRMTYQELGEVFGVHKDCIKRALRRRGYYRRVALRKPPISEKNRRLRLEWAHEHLHWSEEQWHSILWTDETWVKAGRHRKTFVTRMIGEELDPTCIVERIPKKRGWMFWGSFAGDEKGPSLFWEKDWGSIGAESYIAHIIPLIEGWLKLRPHLTLMQDNAPGHSGQATKDDLAERGITPCFWPAFSPDLNPIETVWNKMKDYIAHNFSDNLSYDALRAAVKEAWEAIGQDTLRELVASMPERCQAVIDANGMYTPY
jgi:transposase